MSRFIDSAKRITEATRIAAELGNETTPLIDERFLSMAERATSQEGSFFNAIGRTALAEQRPDSVNHDLTLLPPNTLSDQETLGILGLVDLMLTAEQSGNLTEQFAAFTAEHQIFERIKANPEKPGDDFIVVSNHLQLPDQGFTMGLFHKAAREQGLDRLENYLTGVVGRLIGYYQLGDVNVVDGILRKAGSILKTFPSGGTEAMSEDEQALSLFRAICNHRTKLAFAELLASREGRIVCMNPSGEEDKYNPTLNAIVMRRFGKGTCDMLVDASQSGATIVPLFADYGPDDSIVSFLPPIEPGAIQSREDCDLLGESIAATGTFERGRASLEKPDITRYKQKIVYLGS